MIVSLLIHAPYLDATYCYRSIDFSQTRFGAKSIMIPIRSYRAAQAPSVYARGDPYDHFGQSSIFNGVLPDVPPSRMSQSLVPSVQVVQPMEPRIRHKRASKPKVKTGCKTCKVSLSIMSCSSVTFYCPRIHLDPSVGTSGSRCF